MFKYRREYRQRFLTERLSLIVFLLQIRQKWRNQATNKVFAWISVRTVKSWLRVLITVSAPLCTSPGYCVCWWSQTYPVNSNYIRNPTSKSVIVSICLVNLRQSRTDPACTTSQDIVTIATSENIVANSIQTLPVPWPLITSLESFKPRNVVV